MVERILMAPGGASEATLAELNAKTPDARTDFMAGRVRTAGGQVTVPGGNVGALQLANPSTLGDGSANSKVITVMNFFLATDINADVRFRFDAVLNSPTEIESFMPNRVYETVPGTTTVGIARQTGSGYSTATPGRVLSPVYRLPANIPFQRDFPVVLLPGMSVSVNATSPALQAMVLYASATWSEDPM